MTDPFRLTAADLERWADSLSARGELPALIRRLILATSPEGLLIDFPAEEAAQGGGWDGTLVVQAGGGTAFVPEGASYWELSTEKSTGSKASADYAKRTATPEGASPESSTYVAVSLRRWRVKKDWVKERRAEGKWRDVRAIDASVIETWLELAPGVHAWLGEKLAKRQPGVETLEDFWANWRAVTNPPLTAEIVLAGRQSVSEAVSNWFGAASVAPLAVRADSEDEAKAVVAAAIERLPLERREAIWGRALLVKDPADWARLVSTGAELVLLTGSANAEAIAAAVRAGQRVIFVLGRVSSLADDGMDVPKLRRDEVESGLKAAGLPDAEASELARVARGGLLPLRRRLGIRPEAQQPEWSRPAEGPALVPVLLTGAWNEGNEADRRVVEALAGAPYGETQSLVTRWASESDPPVRCIGEMRLLTSQQDAWMLLGRYVSSDAFKRFEDAAVSVLGTADPKWDLPSEKRWSASLSGKVHPNSPTLIKAIAESIAWLGARGDTEIMRSAAARTVDRVLKQAEGRWELWASLSAFLPYLAEAAPEIILDAIERDLKRERPSLPYLFQDTGDSLFSQSPHVGVLRAIEVLAWSEDHASRAALCLARLARLDPGGNALNRPAASLLAIFRLWFPQTVLSLGERLVVVDSRVIPGP